MFQLDQAIEDWRQICGSSAAVSDSAAIELETHLRDSIERLCESGLSEEEAFLVACHRLGKPAQIHDEYGKVHQRHIWLSRTILMLSGYLIISLVLKFIAFDQATAGLLGLALGWDSTGLPIATWLFGDIQHHWSALLSASAGLLGVGVLVWMLMSFSRGPGHTFLKLDRDFENKLFTAFDIAPRSIGKLVVWWAVLYTGLTVAQMILTIVTVRHFAVQNYSHYVSTLNLYSHGNHFITIVVLLMVTALLCKRYRGLMALPE